MTKEQLSCEKTVLQKNLLHYEGLHGRPVSCLLPQLFSGFRLIYLSLNFILFYFWFCFFLSSSFNQVTREERLVVKPLYDRYRLVKQMLTRVSITPVTVSSSLWCREAYMYTYMSAQLQPYMFTINIPSVSTRCLPPARDEIRPFSPS